MLRHKHLFIVTFRVKNFPPLRFFSGDKVVDSPTLNRLGMQVARTVAARALYTLRPFHTVVDLKPKIAALRRDGVVQFPNFLPQAAFDALRSECMALLDEAQHHKGNDKKMVVYTVGPNTIELAKIRSYDSERYTRAHQFLAHPDLLRIFAAAEKRAFDTNAFTLAVVERLVQGQDNDTTDRETAMHSDVFFDTHKAWLYLDDVNIEDGPFAYVKRSHYLSKTQLAYIYAHSLAEGVNQARRITQAELEKLGLEESVVTAKRNTLVVANTKGYHRRLRGQAGGKRHAIHVITRANPFLWWHQLDQSH